MALPAQDIKTVIRMSEPDRERYFMDYARYIETASKLKYAIRIGSKTLRSDDTMDLRNRFERVIARMKRKMRRA
jgi:hypothetical protein